MGKATKKVQVTMGKKTKSVNVPIFARVMADYSGFGAHVNKLRHADRRNRRLEEKQVQRGNYD